MGARQAGWLPLLTSLVVAGWPPWLAAGCWVGGSGTWEAGEPKVPKFHPQDYALEFWNNPKFQGPSLFGFPTTERATQTERALQLRKLQEKHEMTMEAGDD